MRIHRMGSPELSGTTCGARSVPLLKVGVLLPGLGLNLHQVENGSVNALDNVRIENGGRQYPKGLPRPELTVEHHLAKLIGHRNTSLVAREFCRYAGRRNQGRIDLPGGGTCRHPLEGPSAANHPTLAALIVPRLVELGAPVGL